MASDDLLLNSSSAAASAYVLRIHASPLEINAAQWNALLAQSDAPTPFMRHEYLAALYSSGSATEQTGWQPQFIALYAQDGQELLAACPLYLKTHSFGEYVFDWTWARAYHEYGLAYYPKAVVAVPFTPVPGSRFLCQNGFPPANLLRELLHFCEQRGLSSLHVLFASEADQTHCRQAQLMLRETVQFHWTNQAYASFDQYLASLTQEKRKKIRAERRKVSDAGIRWRHVRGREISAADWDFFYACYERTYLEHGNPPYLTRAFFQSMASDMPEHWLMFIAEQNDQPMASSLIGLQEQSMQPDASAMTTNLVASDEQNMPANGQFHVKNSAPSASKVAYGRYWGAVKRVDSLHFEACYYQPLQWCIENGFERFEGGAQGEHKMARGLLPVLTRSAHWLAHPQFARAVERFLERETAGIEGYVADLEGRSPFKSPAPSSAERNLG